MRIAITMGDPAGIGAEIIVKALDDANIYSICDPLVIGDAAVMRAAIAMTGSKLKLSIVESPERAKCARGEIALIDMALIGEGGWKYGEVSADSGEAAYRYVERAIAYALKGEVDAVATAPINKEALNLAGRKYAGHTEIFAALTGAGDYAMLLASGNLRVVHATTHVSLSDACNMITKSRVLDTIRLAYTGARLFGVERPRVGVAGLNPHSSENGLFGTQERDAIIPAIEAARAEGIDADGPVPPDTVFVKAVGGRYDIVAAMYHDQGHIPLKLYGFRMDPKTGEFASVSGVNCTIGLNFIRTSVDHGTAFDRAGKNIANAQSMKEAIEYAVVMTNNLHELNAPGRGQI